MARHRERELSGDVLSSLRDAMGELRADYYAGTNSRYRPAPPGVLHSGSGADYHYRDETKFLRMIERSRHFDRNNMVVGQGVDRLVANLVREGFTLDVDTGDDGLDEELSNRWYEWCESEEACDFEGEKNFYEFEALAMRHTIVDGDAFFLPLRGGQLQAIEAHRVRTPKNTKRNVVHGVLLEEQSAQRLQYWVTKEDLDPLRPLVKVDDVQAYDARDRDGHRQVFHLYDPKRFSQRRGVTAFAPCVDPINMHDDLQFGTMVKAVVSSAWAILEETAYNPKQPGDSGRPIKTGEETTETLADGTTRYVSGSSPGMHVRGRPGSRLTGFAPNIPNPEFFPHATMILTFVSINLGMPVAMLLLDPSNTNFSGWRGAMDQARIRFIQIQNWLRFHFHRRIYRWKVRQFLTEDAVMQQVAKLDKVNVFGHTWYPPTWPYIEPSKDAAADLLRERNLLISRRRRCAERGYEWKDLSTEIVDDNALVLEKAWLKHEQLTKKYPAWDLQWRELVTLPTPDGIQLSLDLAQDSGEAKDKPDAAPDKKPV